MREDSKIFEKREDEKMDVRQLEVDPSTGNVKIPAEIKEEKKQRTEDPDRWREQP